MSSGRNGKARLGLLVAFAGSALVCVLGGLFAAFRFGHVTVMPEPPRDADVATAFSIPATTSQMALVAHLPRSAIAQELEAVLPRSFIFDTTSAARAYGSLSRGPVVVRHDVASQRIEVSAPVSGKVEVEKKLLAKIGLGLDISGTIRASFAPVVGTEATIDPRLNLSTEVDQAIARTKVGDIEVTGLVRDAVHNLLDREKGPIAARLASALNGRNQIERIWSQLNRVHKLANNPPTWLRMTPQQIILHPFVYTAESIDTGVTLALETHIFVQEQPPDVLTAARPTVVMAERGSDEFHLSLPVEVSYDEINKQLKSRLAKKTFKLAANDGVTVRDATIQPYGDGMLLTVEFSGKSSGFRSVSGRLYIVGVPVFDHAKAELRVEQLECTTATQSLLVGTLDWLAHPQLLHELKAACIVNLDAELKKVTVKANEQLDRLKDQLPSEIGARISVNEVAIERLVFGKERAFAVVTAKGNMSACLNK
jgi:hypothetical protein